MPLAFRVSNFELLASGSTVAHQFGEVLLEVANGTGLRWTGLAPSRMPTPGDPIQELLPGFEVGRRVPGPADQPILKQVTSSTKGEDQHRDLGLCCRGDHD